MRRPSSETLVQALAMSGFTVYRRTPEATILERGVRAVAIRTCAAVDSSVLMDVRRMAGLSWCELDAALAASTREPEDRDAPALPDVPTSDGGRAAARAPGLKKANPRPGAMPEQNKESLQDAMTLSEQSAS